MTQLSEKQVALLEQRIYQGGVSNKGLQNDLLDHFCCFIEDKMNEGSDFESAYKEAFQAITPDGMYDIETELITLLTLNRQLGMKRMISIAGALCALLLTAGIILKYKFLPGAAALITLGIGIATMVFVPVVCIYKIREKQNTADKALWGVGSIFAIALAFSTLFKVQHWPGANMLGSLSLAILLLLFLPIYFFAGIRNPATRINTVVSSVFIVMGCGLYFTLVMTPRAARIADARTTKNYLRSELILKNEAVKTPLGHNTVGQSELANDVYTLCNELKSFLVRSETGTDVIGEDFEQHDIFIRDHSAMDYFHDTPGAFTKLKELATTATKYNNSIAGTKLALPVTGNIVDFNETGNSYKVYNALSDLIQIQMILLQNEKG
ncbi:MAG: hypothetical protein JSS82_04405 [Bacteroidetes bacterium]|nr:hypothetical protein [Bacteroidota bacterium]